MTAPTQTPIRIEPAAPADEAAVRELLRAAELPSEDFAAHLRHFLVARDGGVVVGAVGFELHGRDALLRSLVVAPSRRGVGLGDRLLVEITAWARAAGVTRWFLLTTTAAEFFAQRGFRRVAREAVPPSLAATREFQGLCPASATCLTREVPA